MAEKSRSTLTCVTGSAASARLQCRTAAGQDGMTSHVPFFCKNFDGKWEGHEWRVQREGFGSGRISKRFPNF